MFKYAKMGVVALVLLGGAGLLVFGTELGSYVHSTAHAMRTSVKDSVPVEFELRRARDILDEVLPEMHANIRLIAQEEVEIEALKRDIAEAQDNLADQRQAISSLRDTLAVQQASYTLGGREYGRTEVAEELGRRFERFKEAELVLAGKQRLLSAREKSLRGALEMLNRTRSQKLLMEQKIESLEAQHRLVKAAGRGSGVGVDTGKLAQADKLIQQIHKRLDVAERVLAHEAKFVEHIPVETTDATDVVAQVDEYFQADAPREDIAAAKVAPQVESVPATETP
jgi:hypothetical protein